MTATPEFQVNQIQLTWHAATPAHQTFAANNPDTGNPVDITSGYAVELLYKPSNGPVTSPSGAVITYADGSASVAVDGDATKAVPTGVTVTYRVYISNDSFVTRSLLAYGNITVIPSIGV